MNKNKLYNKLIQLLIQQIIEPSEAVILGGTWRIPVMEELLSRTFIRDLKMDGTYNESSFAREYEWLVLFKYYKMRKRP